MSLERWVTMKLPLPVNNGVPYVANLDAAGNVAIPMEQFIISGGLYVPVSATNPLPTLSAGSLANVCDVLDVTTAGIRVQLPNIPCREVTVIAKRTDIGYIYAGDSLVSSIRYGAELTAKESFTFAVANANQVWIDSSVNGEGISYVAI